MCAMRRRRILLVTGLVLLVLILAEGLARITTGPRWLNANYIKISEGFVELDALINDVQNAPELIYYDEFIFAARPYRSTHVNFTDYFSARLTPDSVSLAEAEHVVWTFGGSTMENTETTDALTIANTWARTFNEALGPSHIKNFGTGGFFSSLELIKFQKLLREVPENELPSMIIFYNGYNDALFGFQYGPGSLQKDLSLKLKALVEQDYVTSAIYAGSRALSRLSRFWERTGSRLVEQWLFELPEPDTSDANLDATVRVYISNVRMTQAICETYMMRCYFVLQPLILTKQPLGDIEQDVFASMQAHARFGSEGIQFVRDFYREVAVELSGNEFFIDASDIMDGQIESVFYDMGHVGAQWPPIIGAEIAHLILSREGASGV